MYDYGKIIKVIQGIVRLRKTYKDWKKFKFPCCDCGKEIYIRGRDLSKLVKQGGEEGAVIAIKGMRCYDCHKKAEEERWEEEMREWDEEFGTPEFDEAKETVLDSPGVERSICKRDGCENQVIGDGVEGYCGFSCWRQAKGFGEYIRKCPFCDKHNDIKAVVCSHCKRDLPPFKLF